MKSAVVNKESTGTNLTISNCKSECKGQGNRYMVMSNSSCYCVDDLDSSAVRADNNECDALCTGVEDDGYCGGYNEEQSVYYVFGKFIVAVIHVMTGIMTHMNEEQNVYYVFL